MSTSGDSVTPTTCLKQPGLQQGHLLLNGRQTIRAFVPLAPWPKSASGTHKTIHGVSMWLCWPHIPSIYMHIFDENFIEPFKLVVVSLIFSQNNLECSSIERFFILFQYLWGRYHWGAPLRHCWPYSQTCEVAWKNLPRTKTKHF